VEVVDACQHPRVRIVCSGWVGWRTQ
jgi:hypothetical protein